MSRKKLVSSIMEEITANAGDVDLTLGEYIFKHQVELGVVFNKERASETNVKMYIYTAEAELKKLDTNHLRAYLKRLRCPMDAWLDIKEGNSVFEGEI